MLSLADDPKQLLKGALSTYDALKAAGFRSSDYLAVAAFCIAEGTPQEGRAETVKRAKAFYDGMRRQHFFLTGREDYIYAAMLGMSGTEVDSGAERLERIYQALKHDYMLGNKVQALSQVLVLSEDETQSIERFRALRGALAAKRLRMDQEFTLSSLGVLSLLPVKIDQIADEVEEVYTYLKAQRGLGAWSTMKQQRLLLAAAVVAFARLEDQSGVVAAALTTAIISIIIAQQVAIIAASSSAAASASN